MFHFTYQWHGNNIIFFSTQIKDTPSKINKWKAKWCNKDFLLLINRFFFFLMKNISEIYFILHEIEYKKSFYSPLASWWTMRTDFFFFFFFFTYLKNCMTSKSCLNCYLFQKKKKLQTLGNSVLRFGRFVFWFALKISLISDLIHS